LLCEAPFGMVKTSGYGRFGGEAAISGCTKLRWLIIQSGQRHCPL
jgi:vanillin dehydrogenase